MEAPCTAPTPARPLRRESFFAAAILLLLTLIAAAILREQRRPHPAVENFLYARASAAAARASASAVLLALPEGLVALTPPERFDRESLSDKIDGKAELYLAAGFVRLDCQRLSLAGAEDSWIEVFLYEMGSFENAFSVFSAQRRPDAAALELTEFAYAAENAFFFVHGTRYVELIASGAGEPFTQAMEAIGRSLIAERPAVRAALTERELFPGEGLVPESIRRIASDAFGLAGLDRVYSAHYRTGGGEATVFFTRRDGPDQAAALARSYLEMLRTFGAEVRPAEGWEGAFRVEVLDTFEVVFTRGEFFGGAREAPDPGVALELARRLEKRLAEAGHAPR
ncbi:MAG: DUF6599 family protein [Desulfobacterales bacterium]